MFTPVTNSKSAITDRFSLQVKGLIHWSKYSPLIRSMVNYMFINILVEAAELPDDSSTYHSCFNDLVHKQMTWG